jgi:GNAT superfamily N-acetyltransferase
MLEVHPVTADRWEDLQLLFGPNGAYSGCWCMWFRQSSAEYERDRGAPNRRAMRDLVEANEVPGLIGYVEGEPAGWVSVAPREAYGRMERSPILQRVDDRPVWSVVCFFIHKRHRRSGLSRRLLDAAVGHARDNGARIVEAYPWDLDAGVTKTSAELFVGTLPMFEAAGFREVARHAPGRPIVRRRLRPRS